METTRYLLLLAEQGNADAQFRIGYRLAFGRNSPKPRDWKIIMGWWQKAADLGVSRANFFLGIGYDFGRGVERNMATVFSHYLAAANKGQVEATYNVGLCYREGEGVEKDLTQAVRWFELAAKSQDAGA